MLIPPSVFELHKLADANASHYVLGGVRFERDPAGKPVAVATNGWVLLAVQWSECPAKEYPAGSVGLSSEHVADFVTIVPVDACKKAGKLPPKQSPKPILKNVLLDESSTNGNVSMAGWDCEAVQSLKPTTLQGRYPKWRDIFPREADDRTVSVQVNARPLIDLLQTMCKVSGDKEQLVTMTLTLDPPTSYELDDDGNPQTAPMASRGRTHPIIISGATEELNGFNVGGENEMLLSGMVIPSDKCKPGEERHPKWIPEV